MSCRFRLYGRISVPWLSADSEVQFLDTLLLCETCPTTGLSYRELGVEHLTKTLVVWDFIDALKKDGVEAMEEIAEWECEKCGPDFGSSKGRRSFGWILLCGRTGLDQVECVILIRRDVQRMWLCSWALVIYRGWI